MQRIWILNWENLVNDHDFSWLIDWIFTDWVLEWLEVSEWKVSKWRAFIKINRASTKDFYLTFENTTDLEIDTSWTKKIYIEIDQNKINDGSLNPTDWVWIWEIKVWLAYPTSNFLALAWVNNSEITDERKFVTTKDYLNLTKFWNEFNTPNNVIKLDWEWKIPELDGSNIKNIIAENNDFSVLIETWEQISDKNTVRYWKSFDLEVGKYEQASTSNLILIWEDSTEWRKYWLNFTPLKLSENVLDFTFGCFKIWNPQELICWLYEIPSLSYTDNTTLWKEIAQASYFNYNLEETTMNSTVSWRFELEEALDPTKFYRIVFSAQSYNTSNYYKFINSDYYSNWVVLWYYNHNWVTQSGSKTPKFSLTFTHKRLEDENKIYVCKWKTFYDENYIWISDWNYEIWETAKVLVTWLLKWLDLSKKSEVNISETWTLESNSETTPYVKVWKMLTDDIMKIY